MSRDEIEKLLSGYATDTLTDAEKRALFAAALEDQELFSALAKEEPLRELLQDPAARQRLLEVLGPASDPFAARAWRWLRQPAVLAAAGGLAVLLIAAGVVLRHARSGARQETIVAQAIPPPAAPQPAPPVPVRAKTQPAPLRKAKRLPLRVVPTVAQEAAPAPPPPAPAAPPPSATGSFATLRRAAERAALIGGNPAIPYTLLRRDPNGSYAPVAGGTVFHAGDSVRLQVQPPEPGLLYLLQRGEAGWNRIADLSVEKNRSYELPPGGGVESGKAGQVELMLLLLRPASTPAARFVPADANALAGAPGAGPATKIVLEYR